MDKRSQAGFAIVELIILVLVLAVLGGSGYLVWHQHQDKSVLTPTASTVVPSASDSQSSSTSAPTAPQVNSASDLNGAMQALNETDLAANNTDSGQLSTQASGF
ncbi:MAG TPA: hypothetical protein VGM08_04280 [Candidatus Saccharimonadales bacterium]|jgi:Tfp pilus assembly protein PilE